MSRLLVPALVIVSLGSLGAASTAIPRAHRTALAASVLDVKRGADCPAGTFPDGPTDRPVCVRFPGEDEGAPATEEVSNAHFDKRGHWTPYDQIPRRPDRPADYDAYRYPIPPGLFGGQSVVSGYDLDRPDEGQRRGRTLSHVGHGGVDLPQARGTPVRFVALEHQQGDAEVLFIGPLFGNTVVTRHTLREGGQLRDYIVLFGHLEGPAPGLAPGATLKEGDTVGFVGDTGSPELVHLHLEVRRVREGVDLRPLAGGGLLAGEVSVVCDPRNVLPLKTP